MRDVFIRNFKADNLEKVKRMDEGRHLEMNVTLGLFIYDVDSLRN